MKCKSVEFSLEESKAEPQINEWLANNSDLYIKSINPYNLEPFYLHIFIYIDEI